VSTPDEGRRPLSADGQRMLDLVAQLSPETRQRLAQGLDDRFHELTGTPRTEDDGCDYPDSPCLVCDHKNCGWCPECSPGVPES